MWAREKGWSGHVCALRGGPIVRDLHVDFGGVENPMADQDHLLKSPALSCQKCGELISIFRVWTGPDSWFDRVQHVGTKGEFTFRDHAAFAPDSEAAASDTEERREMAIKVKKIAAGYTRKFNLGDYNSLELEASCWADIEETDDPAECLEVLQDVCKDAVKKGYIKMAKSIPAKQVAKGKQAVPEPTSNSPAS